MEDDIASLDIVDADQGFDVQMQLAGDLQAGSFSARRRKMAGPVGCGLCGIESIEEALRQLPDRDAVDIRFSHDEIRDAVRSLSMHQELRAQTGAVHAAGFYRIRLGRRSACGRMSAATMRSTS
jgi:FdhD protein